MKVPLMEINYWTVRNGKLVEVVVILRKQAIWPDRSYVYELSDDGPQYWVGNHLLFSLQCDAVHYADQILERRLAELRKQKAPREQIHDIEKQLGDLWASSIFARP